MKRHFVIGAINPELVRIIGESKVYELYRRKAEEFAKSINRELAEGPTVEYVDNYYGPVELWPLVFKEGD